MKRTPNNTPTPPGLTTSWRRLVPLGFFVPSVFFLFYSTLISIPAVTMLVGILGVLGYERVLRRGAHQGFNASQRLGLPAGAIGFFMLFDAVLEIKGSFGMSVAGLAFLVLVYRLRRNVLMRNTGFVPSKVGPELAAPEPSVR